MNSGTGHKPEGTTSLSLPNSLMNLLTRSPYDSGSNSCNLSMILMSGFSLELQPSSTSVVTTTVDTTPFNATCAASAAASFSSTAGFDSLRSRDLGHHHRLTQGGIHIRFGLQATSQAKRYQSSTTKQITNLNWLCMATLHCQCLHC